jgi:hypothetical protein
LPPASSLTERRHRRRAMDRQPSSPPSLPTFSCCFRPSPSVLPPSAATHCDCRRPQFSSRLPQLPSLNGRRCTHDTPHHASPPFLVCLVSPPNHLTVRPLELPPSMICVPASLRALSPLTSSYVIRVSIGNLFQSPCKHIIEHLSRAATESPLWIGSADKSSFDLASRLQEPSLPGHGRYAAADGS